MPGQFQRPHTPYQHPMQGGSQMAVGSPHSVNISSHKQQPHPNASHPSMINQHTNLSQYNTMGQGSPLNPQQLNSQAAGSPYQIVQGSPAGGLPKYNSPQMQNPQMQNPQMSSQSMQSHHQMPPQQLPQQYSQQQQQQQHHQQNMQRYQQPQMQNPMPQQQQKVPQHQPLPQQIPSSYPTQKPVQTQNQFSMQPTPPIQQHSFAPQQQPHTQQQQMQPQHQQQHLQQPQQYPPQNPQQMHQSQQSLYQQKSPQVLHQYQQSPQPLQQPLSQTQQPPQQQTVQFAVPAPPQTQQQQIAHSSTQPILQQPSPIKQPIPAQTKVSAEVPKTTSLPSSSAATSAKSPAKTILSKAINRRSAAAARLRRIDPRKNLLMKPKASALKRKKQDGGENIRKRIPKRVRWSPTLRIRPPQRFIRKRLKTRYLSPLSPPIMISGNEAKIATRLMQPVYYGELVVSKKPRKGLPPFRARLIGGKIVKPYTKFLSVMYAPKRQKPSRSALRRIANERSFTISRQIQVSKKYSKKQFKNFFSVVKNLLLMLRMPRYQIHQNRVFPTFH